MPYSVNRLPAQPIIIITVSDPFDPARDMPVTERQFAVLASEIPGRIFRIIDISRWGMKFTDMIEVLARDTREGPKAAADSRIMTVLVGTSQMAKLAASATSQTQYGYANLPKLFGSIEEALAHIQAELAHPA